MDCAIRRTGDTVGWREERSVLKCEVERSGEERRCVKTKTSSTRNEREQTLLKYYGSGGGGDKLGFAFVVRWNCLPTVGSGRWREEENW